MAEQLEFFSLPNPCRGVCQSDARGYCCGFATSAICACAAAAGHEPPSDAPEQPSLF